MGVEPAPPGMTADEFFVWADGQDGRFELDHGRVLSMSPERTLHLTAKGNLYFSLRLAAGQGRKDVHVLPDGASVRIDGRTVYEPDLLVYAGAELPGDVVAIPNPVVVAEVLSPSTAARDGTVKLAGYFGLPSLSHYLIVDPEERLVIHHARRTGNAIETRILKDGTLSLDPPGLVIAVSDLFDA